MEQRPALPSINGKQSDVPDRSSEQRIVPSDGLDNRPTSAVQTGKYVGHRNLPRSAGARSTLHRVNNGEASIASGRFALGNQTMQQAPYTWQPVQRPSSTQNSMNAAPVDKVVVRVFTPTTRYLVNSGADRDSQTKHGQQQESQPKDLAKDPTYDSRNEVQHLRDENATFRIEIDVLRTKLMEKMRGQSKVIAGGQFRAASASSSSQFKPSVPLPSSSCTKCVLARARALKAHQENEEAQARTTDLQKYVDNVEMIQHRLWEERSSHLGEITKLRDSLAQKFEEYVLIEAECTRLDKQLRERLDENETLKSSKLFVYKAKEGVDAATQCMLQGILDNELAAFHQKEVDALQTDVHRLNQHLAESESQLEKATMQLNDVQKQSVFENDKLQRQAQLLVDETFKHLKKIKELEQALKVSRISLGDLQKDYEKKFQLAQETNQQLEAGIAVNEDTIRYLEQQHKDAILAHAQHQQDLVKALKVRIEQKSAENDRLRALSANHQTTKSDMHRQLHDLERQVQVLKENNHNLLAATAKLEQDVMCAAELEKAERSKLLEDNAADHHRLSEVLHDLEHENRVLKERASDTEAELADQVKLMQRQKRSHVRVLERALESSLRLCVVAPTVNVHVNTNGDQPNTKLSAVAAEKASMKDMSVESVPVVCRSTPQHESVKRVIENEVLPLFTTVFMQADDNASPQAHVPMNRWLEELLHDMQARIATQLESIYSTTSMNESEQKDASLFGCKV